MNGDNPLVADDKLTEAERLKKERQLRNKSLNPHELGSEGAEDLSDDMRGDRIASSEDTQTINNKITIDEAERKTEELYE